MRLLRGRCDDSGCGFGGSRAAWRNFGRLQCALAHEAVCVHVVTAESLAQFAPEIAVGRSWRLGDAGGRCLGTILWCTREQHAYATQGLPVVMSRSRCAHPPWVGGTVAGPKRSGKAQAKGAAKAQAGRKSFEEQLEELRGFLNRLGRLPNQKSEDKEEKTLAVWLNN